ncbi:MAG: hypothetical protein ACLT5P_05285 [Flavonifractor plautii]
MPSAAELAAQLLGHRHGQRQLSITTYQITAEDKVEAIDDTNHRKTAAPRPSTPWSCGVTYYRLRDAAAVSGQDNQFNELGHGVVITTGLCRRRALPPPPAAAP